MHHGRTQDNLGLLAQKALVTLGRVLKTLAIRMLLAADGNVFKNLAIEHLHLLVAYHQVVEVGIGDGIELGVLQGFHNEATGFLLQVALYAEDNAPLEAEMLGDIALVLIIILTDHSTLYII